MRAVRDAERSRAAPRMQVEVRKTSWKFSWMLMLRLEGKGEMKVVPDRECEHTEKLEIMTKCKDWYNRSIDYVASSCLANFDFIFYIKVISNHQRRRYKEAT